MENNFFMTEDMLWDYADDFLSAADKMKVDGYLQQHPEWRERLDVILAEKRAFTALSLETPDAGFADRVMTAWASEQAHGRATAPEKGQDRMIYLISAVFGLFICSALVFMVLQGIPARLPVEVPAVSLPEVNWGGIFGTPVLQYGLYFVLTLLALKVVEKYLHQRQMVDKLKMQ